MRPIGSVFTIRSLMFVVAIVALILAATRMESTEVVAISLVGGCIALLTYLRFSQTVALKQAAGETIDGARKKRILLSSATLAVTIIGLSDLAFLAGFFGLVSLTYESRRFDYVPAILLGGVLALLVASSLRQTLWTRKPSRSSLWWITLWPVALAMIIGGLVIAESAIARYSYCRQMAERHALLQAQPYGSDIAAFHARRKRWYERAAFRPWMTTDPWKISRDLE